MAPGPAIVAAVPDLISISEAVELVLARVRPLAAERVPLDAAAGRYVAEAAHSLVDLPPFPASAMDGFALRSEDTPGRLPIAGRIVTGTPSPDVLAAGQTIGISTGGVVPDGADAVVPVELVTEEGDTLVVPKAVVGGDNIRPRGGDLAAGDVVVAPGTRLGPAHVGALAAGGVPEVAVGRRPRVCVLVTGSELQAPGTPLGPGQIYDANGSILAAQLSAAGAEVERLPPVRDDEEATFAAIKRGLEADVLITTGGVSVGVHDLVRSAEAQLGVEEIFWRVAMRPGKPIAFGVRGSTLVFGLPGNPVSSLVGFELFVRPALLALQGATNPHPEFLPGRLVRGSKRVAERDSLIRARRTVRDGEVLLEPLSGQDSHMIARAATADALVLVPRGDGVLEAGSAVEFLPL